MKYDEFIKHVQSVAQVDSREQTERVTRATLETIKERIVGDEAKDLAAQLPEEIAQYLRGRESENGQHFKLQEFIERVSKKADVESTDAIMHVRAVFTVLQNAVSPGEFADFKHNFSDDYAELFPTINI
ncbi:DUF2267 domain-containing protein [Plectonema cf. radiosum LEGE 06105]|uniref:DUF2267 domain-containing protein n=1 Tax=Plectonema cf. radiosum LEGE 06105 TaxID=945769 RepID=A0A8J7FE22_9CYAN|nr:DUF2267 domain-containing protein [Plectonema radiosum]MBE9215919.1 DUF2267 domain-containing protein [Plectonema cf. radiosum LEGE 06105]